MSTNPPARILYACPPWPLEDNGTLSVSEIVRHPLPPIADGAALILERPSEFAEEAYQVARYWGFRPRNEIVIREDGNVRIALLAVRGHFLKSADAALLATKPAVCVVLPGGLPEFLERYAHKKGPFIEIFGTKSRKGWHVYGFGESLPETVPIGGKIIRYGFIAASEEQKAEEGNKKASTCDGCGAEYFGPAHTNCPASKNVIATNPISEQFGQAHVPMIPVTAASVRVTPKGSPLFTDVQKRAWLKRGLADGIFTREHVTGDVNTDYMMLLNMVPSTWAGWSEEQIVDEVKPDRKTDTTPAPTVAAGETVTMYECPNCGLNLSKGLIKKHDGCCMGCGSPMGDATPVMGESTTYAAPEEPIKKITSFGAEITETPRDVAPHMENLSTLVNSLAMKRAIVDLTVVSAWTPEQRREAMGWVNGSSKKKPEFITVKRGRLTNEEKAAMNGAKTNGAIAPNDSWADTELAVDDGEDPDHPSFYWHAGTPASEKESDISAWRENVSAKNSGELTAEEKRVLGLRA